MAIIQLTQGMTEQEERETQNSNNNFLNTDKLPASQPEQAPTSSVSEANTSSYVASLELGVCYYDVIDPETGKHVDIYNSRYNDLKKQLGGDAGTVPSDQSTACQAALAQYKAKQAAASSASTKQNLNKLRAVTNQVAAFCYAKI